MNVLINLIDIRDDVLKKREMNKGLENASKLILELAKKICNIQNNYEFDDISNLFLGCRTIEVIHVERIFRGQ